MSERTDEPPRGFDDYPKPGFAVDPVILAVVDGSIEALLWRRTFEPELGRWALPGVFVQAGEQADRAVVRAARAKACLVRPPGFDQLFLWDRPGRDPRGWVVVMTYFGMARHEQLARAAEGSNDLLVARIQLPESKVRAVVRDAEGARVRLAFDHEHILGVALDRIRGRLRSSDLAFNALPKEFTLRELQQVHETLLGRKLNKDSFRRQVLLTDDVVEGTGTLRTGVGRPAELYRRRLPR